MAWNDGQPEKRKHESAQLAEVLRGICNGFAQKLHWLKITIAGALVVGFGTFMAALDFVALVSAFAHY